MHNTRQISLTLFIAFLAHVLAGCGTHAKTGQTSEPQVSQAGVSESGEKPLTRFVIYGDTRTNHIVHQEIVNAVVAANPDFILQTGDLVQFSVSTAQWKKFDQITRPIRDKNIPYYPARGNHDSGPRSRYASEVRDKIDSGNKLYYRFDSGNLRFICLDTESKLNERSEQYTWLVAELEKAKADGKFVIPLFHRAIFSIGMHGSNEPLQTVLHPLFRKYGVKLVFEGHDHLYYRTLRDGITYVVTGGGGAPLYNFDPALVRKDDVAKKLHHYCIAAVFPDRIDVTVLALVPNQTGFARIDQFSLPLNAAR